MYGKEVRLMVKSDVDVMKEDREQDIFVFPSKLFQRWEKYSFGLITWIQDIDARLEKVKMPSGHPKYIQLYIHIIHINLFLHKLPFSKTKINFGIHHSHNGIDLVTKIKIYLRLFFQGGRVWVIVSSSNIFSVVFWNEKALEVP